MRVFSLLLLIFTFSACSTVPKVEKPLKIAFGSCSKQTRDNQLWKEILNENPDYFVFLGDAVYPEKYDVEHLEKAYQQQVSDKDYQELAKKVMITGVYDDHDFGLNDGGIENPIKLEAKHLFLKYIETSMDGLEDKMNINQPLYYTIQFPHHDVDMIILDTRYERTALKKSNNPNKRYDPINEGTILGENQWQKLEADIRKSNAKTIVIISSIQFLNTSHGFEKWGNMPHERQRFLDLLAQYPQKKFIVLSGDRHFSEVSEFKDITEITSSGLTEVYTLANEPNPLRQGELIKEPNFGLLVFEKDKIWIKLIGNSNRVLKTAVLSE